MAHLSLVLACAAGVAVALPGPAMFAAMSLAILALACGRLSYRDRAARAGLRLTGAAAMAVGGVALTLAVARCTLSVVAVERMASLVSG